MSGLSIRSNPDVAQVFQNYPSMASQKLSDLRQLILDVADETNDINQIEETLKWREPSYIAPKGSTIRIDWKSKSPHQYAMYFQCTSRLISTFKLVYKNSFQFEGNRAIIFNLKDDLPVNELKSCIKTALNYHRLKHLPTLGL